MSEATQEEAIEMIRGVIEKIDEWRIDYSLRDFGLPRVRPASVNIIRICVALQVLGLPITTEMLEFFVEKKSALYTVLHRLGDYDVLRNIDVKGGRTLRYVINPDYFKLIRWN